MNKKAVGTIQSEALLYRLRLIDSTTHPDRFLFHMDAGNNLSL